MLFNLVKKIFAKKIKELQNESYNDGYSQNRKNDEINRAKCELIEYEMMLNKPVICISNEWDNPVIGFVTKIDFITKAQSPVLIVKNYLTGQEHMTLGKSFIYTAQRLEAILKLNPFELCSLVYNNFYYETEVIKEKSGVRNTNEEIMKKLTESGFFEDVKRKSE